MNKYIYKLLLILGIFNCKHILGMEDGLSFNQTEITANIPLEIWEAIIKETVMCWIKNTLKKIFEENINNYPLKIGTHIQEHFSWVENKASGHIIYYLKELASVYPVIKYIITDSSFIMAYKAQFVLLLRQYLNDYKFYEKVFEKLNMNPECQSFHILIKTHSNEDCYNTFKLLANFTDIYKQPMKVEKSLTKEFITIVKYAGDTLGRIFPGGILNMLKFLINHPQLDINAKGDHYLYEYPLDKCEVSAMKFLLIHPQINPNIEGKNGTPLNYNIEMNLLGDKIEHIKLLLTHPRTDITYRSQKGWTPLEFIEKKWKKAQRKLYLKPTSEWNQSRAKELDTIKQMLLKRQEADKNHLSKN